MTATLQLGHVYLHEDGGHYRPLNLAIHARSHQEVIVYEALDGADAGLWGVCPLDYWSTRFTRAALSPDTPETEIA